MERDRGIRTLAIVALCLSVIGLSIGFAAISQDLNLNGTATKKANTFKVEFANLISPAVKTPVTGGEVIEVAPASIIDNSTKMTFNVSFKLPGDKIVYTFDVVNKGTINANLKSVDLTNLTGAAADDIICTWTYSGGTAFNPGTDVLTVDPSIVAGSPVSGFSKTLTLTIQYDPLATTLPSVDEPVTLTAKLTYEQ